ncbi:MAG TPA: sulfatase-like hydrolase/transferase, partial [Acidimicrobiales bacterium]|nr:sulfatase-like hydrolase/transferase [Acidimicrobiales bacterium]
EGFRGATGDAVDVFRQLVSLNAEAEVQVDQFTEEVLSVPAADEPSGAERGVVANQPARFTSFLEGMVEGEDPTFHFAHLILPHGPWRFFPDGTEYESPDGDPEGEIGGTWAHEWPTELTKLRLELQARYTDALIGQTIERMQATGLWRDAVFVLVADHGGAFVVDSPGRALSDTNAHEVMWTPLFIRAPGLPHGVDDTDVEATDLLPTIADILEVDVPYEDVYGRSAISDPDTSGIKRYQRLQNPFQPEPDALVEVDVASNYERLLSSHWPDIDVADPVGAFYRRYPLGPLHGRSVDELPRGSPAGSAELDQLDRLQAPPDGPLPAYLGGQVDVPGSGEGTWVVVAVDGVVQGFSQLFPMVDTESAFAVLLDQEVAAGGPHEVELFVTTGADQPLRPLELS